MTTHFYLSLLPEALIVSMLDPKNLEHTMLWVLPRNPVGRQCFSRLTPVLGILIFASKKH
jgi:hypothetical protein